MAEFQLVTRRILLRPWRHGDRAQFAAMNADPAVMRFFAAPMTRAESDLAVDRYIVSLAREGFSFLVAEHRETGDFLGIIGLESMRDVVPNLPQPVVEIGWRLTTSAQGRGFATEGARAVVDFAFDALRLPELVAITVPVNRPSRRVMEKLGMTHIPELTFLHPRVPAGHPYQQHVLYRLRASFRANI